jgi:hypothetical protein
MCIQRKPCQVEIAFVFSLLSDKRAIAQAGNKELLTIRVGKFFPVDR